MVLCANLLLHPAERNVGALRRQFPPRHRLRGPPVGLTDPAEAVDGLLDGRTIDFVHMDDHIQPDAVSV